MYLYKTVLNEKLSFPQIYVNQRFITVFKTARQLPLSWNEIDPPHALAIYEFKIYFNFYPPIYY
jgi:hypothetical protein